MTKTDLSILDWFDITKREKIETYTTDVDTYSLKWFNVYIYKVEDVTVLFLAIANVDISDMTIIEYLSISVNGPDAGVITKITLQLHYRMNDKVLTKRLEIPIPETTNPLMCHVGHLYPKNDGTIVYSRISDLSYRLSYPDSYFLYFTDDEQTDISLLQSRTVRGPYNLVTTVDDHTVTDGNTVYEQSAVQPKGVTTELTFVSENDAGKWQGIPLITSVYNAQQYLEAPGQAQEVVFEAVPKQVSPLLKALNINNGVVTFTVVSAVNPEDYVNVTYMIKSSYGGGSNSGWTSAAITQVHIKYSVHTDYDLLKKALVIGVEAFIKARNYAFGAGATYSTVTKTLGFGDDIYQVTSKLGRHTTYVNSATLNTTSVVVPQVLVTLNSRFLGAFDATVTGSCISFVLPVSIYEHRNINYDKFPYVSFEDE